MSQTGAGNLNKLREIIDPLFQSDISFHESQKLYNDWKEQGTYDSYHTDPNTYLGPVVAKRAAVKYFKDPKSQLILDLGAGTGISGEALHDCGFRNIHALEPAKGFAEEAEKKGVYSNILIENLGLDKPVSPADDTYDGIVSVGAFAQGHIPCNALHEIIRITKPGGHVIISMREEYLRTATDYRHKLEPLMRQLEEEGKWRMLLREIYPNHYIGKDGLLFVFRVC